MKTLRFIPPTNPTVKRTPFRFCLLFFCVLVCAGHEAGAQTFTTLHSFSGGATDGFAPYAGLVQGQDGFLYGTTSAGGTEGEGTVFRISTNSPYTATIVYPFTDVEGYSPAAPLLQTSDGNVYGTTESGTPVEDQIGYGTLFRISISGTNFMLKYLHAFSNMDGSKPVAGLVQGTDGYVYGTTSAGGPNGSGTVFRISTNGPGFTLTNLHFFTGGSDGSEPDAGLIQGQDGNFYGTTYDGGGTGVGTVFEISPNPPYPLTTLHAFTYSDGGYPLGGLVQGQDGFLYGTTSTGGDDGDGTVFQISTNGPGYTMTNLYSFTGGNDGSGPHAGLIQGSDGYLYGTTSAGGVDNDGTLFRIGTNGPSYSLTNLHSFTGETDGSDPESGLVQGSDGNFYGTTSHGGADSGGTVFKLGGPAPALGPGCPSDITTNASGPNGTVVFFNLLTNGGCPPVTVTAVPPSGSTFPIGTNTVEVTASDSCGNEAKCSFTIAVVPIQTVTNTSIVSGPIVFNPQTGLFDQTVTFNNYTSSNGTNFAIRTTHDAISAVRISVLGLPSGVQLYNASGKSNGVPYVEYDQTVPAGGSVVFTLEYYDSTRQAFAAFVPTNFVATVVPATTVPTPTGTTLQLDSNGSFLSQGQLTIEFASVPGHTYVVEYSGDMQIWLTATPPIVAKNTITQWVDTGPPVTQSPPGSPGQRFYRVVQTN